MTAIANLNVMLAADVVGYSRLVEADAEDAPSRLEAHRHQFVHDKAAEHHGRILRATDDKLLIEFSSPVEAVRCAVEMQQEMIDRNLGASPERRITFRIGVDIGKATTNEDLISRAVAVLPVDQLATLVKPDNPIYGDGAEIALRLAALAAPGGICISGTVWEAICDRLPYAFEEIGEQKLDSRAAPVRCYAMSAASVASKPHFTVQTRRGAVGRTLWLRRAAAATTLVATVAVWAVALWVWLGANSPTAPVPARTTADSHVPAVSTTVTTEAQTPSASEASVASNTAADRTIQPPSALQVPLTSNTAEDRSAQASSPPPRLPAVGAAVIRGKETPSTRQTTTDSGPPVIRGIQGLSAVQTTPGNGTVVVRGR